METFLNQACKFRECYNNPITDQIRIMENKTVKIEVIGSGCANCRKLHELAVAAAEELKVGVKVEYSDDVQRALAMGVVQFPVLAVNGRPALTGSISDIKKVKRAIEKGAAASAAGVEPSGCCPCSGDCDCL